jgi:hypothetical protein
VGEGAAGKDPRRRLRRDARLGLPVPPQRAVAAAVVRPGRGGAGRGGAEAAADAAADPRAGRARAGGRAGGGAGHRAVGRGVHAGGEARRERGAAGG